MLLTTCIAETAGIAAISVDRTMILRRQPQLWMAVRIRAKMAQRKKLAWPLLALQPLLAVEPLGANDGWAVRARSMRGHGASAGIDECECCFAAKRIFVMAITSRLPGLNMIVATILVANCLGTTNPL
jgi:hypothetical protein